MFDLSVVPDVNKVNLKHKVALITGGAKRVGRAITLELAQAGCDVVIHCRKSQVEAEELAALIQATGRRTAVVTGDLQQSSHWPRIIEQSVSALGQLDILINNASVFMTEHADTLDAFDSNQWEKMIRVNLTAPAALTHFATPFLQAGGWGKVINLCDIAAKKPWPGHLAYCASKAGLVNLTKSLALSLAPSVQVNGVAPGIAIFPVDFDEALRKKITAKVPMGKEGSPEDIAKLVRFLVEFGDYITGQVIPVDGGTSM